MESSTPSLLMSQLSSTDSSVSSSSSSKFDLNVSEELPFRSRAQTVHSSRPSQHATPSNVVLQLGGKPWPCAMCRTRGHSLKDLWFDFSIDHYSSRCSPQLISVSASDLAVRRSVFSRRHYGSVEQVDENNFNLMNNAGRFRLETGCSESDLNKPDGSLNTLLHLENPESQTRWYFKYFLGKVHQVYVGSNSEKEPFVMVVVITDAENHAVNQYRVILWHKLGSQKLCLPFNGNNPLSVKKILHCFDLHRHERSVKEIFNPEVQKAVLTLEEQEGSVNFKFGILYAKEGQISDEEMYNNVSGSETFQAFVNLMGQKIQLKDWDKFKGGLDTRNGTTGSESVYTVYEGHEIMFHVSTLLPHSTENRQQVERKRHVGNDIVNIIFIDNCNPSQQCSWKPSMMKTHFTHIFALIIYDSDNDCYRLNISSKDSVPLFGPPLPSPPEFRDKQQFRDFLLVKLINGEKAAFNSTVFAQKRQRTMEMLLCNIFKNFVSDNCYKTARRTRDVIDDQQLNHPTHKQEAHGIQFARIGQSLKLKIILHGNAPTSLINSSVTKQEPWKPHLVYENLFFEVICGDIWDKKMIICSNEGVFQLEEPASVQPLIDGSVVVKQISIVEYLNLMILRVEKGKDSHICIFPLNDFKESVEELPLTKKHVKIHKNERTKGCHLFSLSKSYTNPLRMIVAVGRKLQLYLWKLSSSCSSSLSSWNQVSEKELTSSFQFIRELPTFEAAQVMTLIDGGLRGHNRICIGYRNQFDLIDEQTGDTIHLLRHDSSKAQVVAAIEVYADDEIELLLCLNRICHLQKLTVDQSSSQFASKKKERTATACLSPRTDIHSSTSSTSSFITFSTGVSLTAITLSNVDFCWNMEPDDIVIVFPYVFAFADNAIEVRLIINGNLVHTINVSNCRLISSKLDIYFIASEPDLAHDRTRVLRKSSSSTDAAFHNFNSTSNSQRNAPQPFKESNVPNQNTLFLYCIPLTCLTGGHSHSVFPSTCISKTKIRTIDHSSSLNYHKDRRFSHQ